MNISDKEIMKRRKIIARYLELTDPNEWNFATYQDRQMKENSLLVHAQKHCKEFGLEADDPELVKKYHAVVRGILKEALNDYGTKYWGYDKNSYRIGILYNDYKIIIQKRGNPRPNSVVKPATIVSCYRKLNRE
jgi:hypothetical protein